MASGRSPSFALRMHERNFDQRIPIIYERRRFTDVMDEEIDDERKSRFRRYGTGQEGVQVYRPRRLKQELGTRSDVHAEAEAIIEAKRDGMPPFLREKPKTVAMVVNQPAQFACLAVGDPLPTVQWYKNDVLLVSGVRITITEDGNGSSTLKFDPANDFDAGIYKVSWLTYSWLTC